MGGQSVIRKCSHPRPPSPTKPLDLRSGRAAGATGAEPAVGSWAIGVIVIVLGVIFLAKNLGWTGPEWAFDNWWALFILIPAFGSLAGAWRAYRRERAAG